MIRTGLRAMLEAEDGLRVIGEAADAPGAASWSATAGPTSSSSTCRCREPSPRATSRALREEVPATRIVVLTMQSDPRRARELLRAGASGYVLKQAAERQLTAAILAAAEGGSYIDPELGGQVAQLGADPLEALGERDQELLRLLALGHTNREIGEKLFLSVRAVEVNRAKLLETLGLETRPELVRFAIANGVIDAERDGG